MMGMNSTKYGGMEKFNVELVKQGVDLSLVYNTKPQSVDYIHLLDNYGVPLYICNVTELYSFIQLLRIIIKESPDIIHYHFSGFAYHLISICIFLFSPKTKQVHTIHCEPNEVKGFRGFIIKLFYKCQNQIIATSHGVHKRFVEIYGPNYNVIVSHMGVQRGEIKNGNIKDDLDIKSDTLVITSIGWDIHIKGYDILLKAVSQLVQLKLEKDFIILLIGLPEAEERALKILLKQYNLIDVCLSVGIREDIDDLLNITDIYIQPSRSEAISLSIMEALQYGIPIIGSNVGGIPEVCVHEYNGLLFETQNEHDLCSKLASLISSSCLRDNYGVNSYELSKQYIRSRRAKNLKDIYERLLHY